MTPDANWTSLSPSNGLRIFDFHPIHVCLNMASLDSYRVLKNTLGARKLHDLQPEDAAPFINNESSGTRTFLESVVGRIHQDRFATMSSITRMYLEHLS